MSEAAGSRSPQVWLTLACTLLGVGCVMAYFERWHTEDDYGHIIETSFAAKLLHGAYFSFAGARPPPPQLRAHGDDGLRVGAQRPCCIR